MSHFDLHHNPASMQVEELEFALVSGQHRDRQVDAAITDVLRVVHEKMGIHLLFACETRVGAQFDPMHELSDAGQWCLFDAEFCEHSVMPTWRVAGQSVPLACFTVPVVLENGRLVGVIFAPRYAADNLQAQQELREVERATELIVRRIDERCAAIESGAVKAGNGRAHAASGAGAQGWAIAA